MSLALSCSFDASSTTRELASTFLLAQKIGIPQSMGQILVSNERLEELKNKIGLRR
jgi:hypothetical protein